MPLQKQIIPVALNGGLDTKTDPKQVIPGHFLSLENVVFTSPGRLRKRNGYATLPATGSGVGQGLATYLKELLTFDGTSAYSYSAGTTSQQNKGAFQSVVVTANAIVRNTYQQNYQDGGTHIPTGLQCYAYQDTQGSVRYTIIDGATNQVLVPSTQLVANAQRPKVIVTANYFIILAQDATTNTVSHYAISVGAPTVAPSGVVVANDVAAAAAGNWDASWVNGQVGVFWNSTTATTIKGRLIGPGLILSGIASFATGAASVCMGVFSDPIQNTFVCTYFNSTVVHAFSADGQNLSVVLVDTPIETVSNVVSVTGTLSNASVGGRYQLYYTVSAASSINWLVRRNTWTASGPGTPAVLLRSVFLASKAIANGTLAPVLLGFAGTFQTPYFLSDSTGRILAKPLASSGGGWVSTGPAAHLPELAASGGTTYSVACLQKDLLTTVANVGATPGTPSTVLFTQTGVTNVTLNFFDSQNSYQSATLANNLHVSGGVLSMYDGQGFVEHGFHLWPEGTTAAITNTVGGTGVGLGTYQYVACYEWTDLEGNIHRSAPSVPVSVTTINATSQVTVTVPTLRITAKTLTNGRTPPNVVVYRTAVNGTVFYRLIPPTTPLVNDPTADTVGVVDITTTDTTLVGFPLLYTTGAVVESIAPPAMGPMAVYRQRLWGLSTENKTQLWYSTQAAPGGPIRFSDFFVYNVDPAGGDITAVEVLDANLIIFKRDRIFATAGDGPNETGQQNDIADAQLVTTDAGCVDPRSVVRTPDGLMFRSDKGIYLLDRSLACTYVGAPVERYNGQAVISAVLIEQANEVRFGLGTVTLVYNYLFKLWSVFTNQTAVDAISYKGSYVFLQPGGASWQETPGAYTDNGAPIKMKAQTSWLSLAGLSGFQRVYKAAILGEYASPHNLVVSVAYDFVPATSQSDTIVPTPPTTWGAGATWGSDGVWGASFPKYQYILHFAQQKCTAVQLTLEDSGSYGEAASWSAITLLCGIKGGLNRLPAAAQYG